MPYFAPIHDPQAVVFSYPTLPTSAFTALGDGSTALITSTPVELRACNISYRQDIIAALDLRVQVMKYNGVTTLNEIVFELQPVASGLNGSYNFMSTSTIVIPGANLFSPALNDRFFMKISNTTGLLGPVGVSELTVVIGFVRS